MLILRSIFIIIFVLLFVSVSSGMVHSVNPEQSNLPILVFFAIIIAVLGPLWPSEERIENSKLKLLTDNPKVAYPLFMVGVSLMSFYFAVDAWLSPGKSYSHLAATAYSLFGNEGVIGFWIVIGFLSLVGAFHAYNKFKSA